MNPNYNLRIRLLLALCAAVVALGLAYLGTLIPPLPFWVGGLAGVVIGFGILAPGTELAFNGRRF